MTTLPLTFNTPLPLRLRAWAAERFPLGNTVFALIVYLAALLTGRALTAGGELWLSAADCAGFAGVWGYFLMLRVFDEHKDYHLDASNHPERVLQRGLVTLGHLKLVGAIAVALQVASVLIAGSGRVALLWALAFVWSLLMLKEFFAGEWLERHFVSYAASHLLAMPLALVWMAQVGAGERALPASVLWLAAGGWFFGAAVEIARKLRAPGDEQLGITTYSKLFGVRLSAAAVCVCLLVFTGTAGALLAALEVASAPALVALAGALAPALGVAAAFARRPTSAGAKRVEAAVGAAVAVSLLTVIVALLADRGL